MDVTILKVDMEGATFNAPFGGNMEGGAEADEETEGFDEEASRARGIAALVGLAFLLAGALLVRRVLADDGEEAESPLGEEEEIEIGA